MGRAVGGCGPSSPYIQTRALGAACWLAHEQGDAIRATAFLNEAMSIEGANELIAFQASLTMVLGLMALERGELESARSSFADALARMESLGDTTWTAYLLKHLGLSTISRATSTARRLTSPRH